MAADALCGHLPMKGAACVLQGQSFGHRLNNLYLGGVLAADPQRDIGRDGEPVALLVVAFPAPDDCENAEWPEAASCEVEVPENVAEVHDEELRAGALIFITGQLNGGGRVIATEVHSGPPPAEAG